MSDDNVHDADGRHDAGGPIEPEPSGESRDAAPATERDDIARATEPEDDALGRSPDWGRRELFKALASVPVLGGRIANAMKYNP